MLKLGLVGKNISHSRSKEMYEKILGTDVDYHLLDYKDEQGLPEPSEYFMQGFKGISITYPYKKSFLSQVEVLEPSVQKIGAINCLRLREGKVEATNTDFLAANELLGDFKFEDNFFVVLGNGNMGKIFVEVLESRKASFDQLYRAKNGDLNAIDYSKIKTKNKKTNLVVINCCSREFIFRSTLPSNSVFWDMNYSMPDHQCIQTNEVSYREGLDLLEMQARFALSYWKIANL